MRVDCLLGRCAPAALLLLVSCGWARTAGPEAGPVGPGAPAASEVTTVQEANVAEAYTQFGFDLFGRVVGDRLEGNHVVSPLSVAIALAMAYNGAAGETRAAMGRVLHMGPLSLEALTAATHELVQTLEKADPNVRLFIANSLWARTGVPFHEPFLARVRQHFEAEIATLDFAAPSAVERINAWVSEHTNGRITQIVEPPIDPQMVLYLINAIYFKGQWTKPFEKEQTRERPFTLLGGAKKPAPMMEQHGKFDYLRGPNFQAVSLPYGKQTRFSMYVFLPDAAAGLKEFLGGLNAESWRQWTGQLRRREGTVALPRFTVEYAATLNDALKALDMAVAFTPDKADFGAMTPKEVFISEVKHKTFIEVNEAGTEAAAVTSIGIAATAAMPAEAPFIMIIDRPFFFAIRDNVSGAVLFMGAIVDPLGK